MCKKSETGDLTPLYSQGDSIRGNINKATFYGKIRTTNGKELYVNREELKYKKDKNGKGFKSWDDLETRIVDKGLFKKLKSQFPEGTSFKDASQTGIYMLNKKNEKIHKIRHIRCIAPTNAGPVPLKKHTYPSNKEYKQFVYASAGDLYTMARYSNGNRCIYRTFSLYTISKSEWNNRIPNTIEEKGKTYNLDYLFKKNDMLLLFKDDIEEIKELTNEDIAKRLYYVKSFEGDKTISLIKHNTPENNTPEKGSSVKDFNNLPVKIRCSINTINFIILGRDFEIINGKIELKS